MKKIKEFFVRWFNWFFCKEVIIKKCTDSYKECHEYLEPKITEEPSKENKEENETVNKEIIDPVRENSRKKSDKKRNTTSTDNREKQKKSEENEAKNILQSMESNETVRKKTERNGRKKVGGKIPKEEDYRVEVAEKRKRLKNKSGIK